MSPSRSSVVPVITAILLINTYQIGTLGLQEYMMQHLAFEHRNNLQHCAVFTNTRQRIYWYTQAETLAFSLAKAIDVQWRQTSLWIDFFSLTINQL